MPRRLSLRKSRQCVSWYSLKMGFFVTLVHQHTVYHFDSFYTHPHQHLCRFSREWSEKRPHHIHIQMAPSRGLDKYFKHLFDPYQQRQQRCEGCGSKGKELRIYQVVCLFCTRTGSTQHAWSIQLMDFFILRTLFLPIMAALIML